MHSGPFIDIYQIQWSFNPHVNFCLEVLRIFLVTVFGLSIHKLQNGEDKTSLPLLVKKLFDHVYELKLSQNYSFGCILQIYVLFLFIMAKTLEIYHIKVKL